MDPSALLLSTCICKQSQPALHDLAGEWSSPKGTYTRIDGDACCAVRLAASCISNMTLRYVASKDSAGRSCGFRHANHDARRVIEAYVAKDETIVVEFFGGIHFSHLIASTASGLMKKTNESLETHFGESLHHVFSEIFAPVSLPESFKCSGCQVAKAFWQDWLDAGTQLMEQLNQLIPQWPTSPLVVVGRSFGAPLATIAAAHMASIGLKPDAVITMATPRTGNKAFAAHMERLFPSSYLNLINDRDYVPLLPPLLGDWTHIGTTFAFHLDDSKHEYTVQRCPYSSSLNPFYPCRGRGPDGLWQKATTFLNQHLQAFATTADVMLDHTILQSSNKSGDRTEHLEMALDDPEGFISSGLTKNIQTSKVFERLLAPAGTKFDVHWALVMFKSVPTDPRLRTKCKAVSHAIADSLSKCDRKQAAHQSAINAAQCRIEAMELPQ